jgi:hypothetical protein
MAVTALNVYGTNTPSTTLSSAGLLVSVTGASGNGQNTTKVGTTTQYVEIFGNGTTAAQTGVGSIPAATGNGWLFDTTLLEGQQIVAGTYTPLIRAKVSGGTASVDMYVRFSKLAADLITYTTIGTCSLTGQSLTTAIANYNFAGNSLSAVTFGTGDKLYVDVWFNIISRTGASSTDTIAFTNANSATQGRASNAEFDTPGYNAVAVSNIQITNVGVNMMRSANAGTNNPVISYVALGTGNTAPSATDNQLVNEVLRKPVTSYANGATGEILITGYFSTSDAVGVTIQEIGFFGGGSATSAANSGALVARGLYTLSKTNNQSLQAVLDLTYTHL